ncbi:unnamed protein product [Porites evermanni]|uniref:Uncharacterized protein n=1 Tax=Porites evermanni TaxID=104178 RepID=A0ABN8MNS9_9CNID|nr:unnamed protein product [Porites evermanni]
MARQVPNLTDSASESMANFRALLNFRQDLNDKDVPLSAALHKGVLFNRNRDQEYSKNLLTAYAHYPYYASNNQAIPLQYVPQVASCSCSTTSISQAKWPEKSDRNHSSIMNHCHLLLTLSAIYDPTFYYTSEELHGKNVQESPLRTYAGSFMGPDHPLQEVESGEQIGGGFGCRGCTGASASYIDHVMWFTEGTTHYPRIKKKKGKRHTFMACSIVIQRRKSCQRGRPGHHATAANNVLKRSPLRTYPGSFMGPNHPLPEVESGEQIGGGFGCCGCTGASASYID